MNLLLIYYLLFICLWVFHSVSCLSVGNLWILAAINGRIVEFED